jgi:uncharacterized membrane protein
MEKRKMNPTHVLRNISVFLLAVLFGFAGFLHFKIPGFYERLMPDWLPHWLHTLAGVAEMALALLLILKSTRKWASYMILAMLASFLLVHGWHLTAAGQAATGITPGLAWGRFAGQFVLMVWVWWTGRKPRPTAS